MKIFKKNYLKVFVKLNVVSVSFVFILLGCQTSDFGLVTEDKDFKEIISTPDSTTESLDQKKVNKNKLFNTSSDTELVRPKIGLILGPGLAYTLAHLGVLKAINDQKIPIHVIAGMEWSSLIAANYALNGAINDMRWKAFQGSFSNVVSTGFLRGSVKETSNEIFNKLISEYTRGRSIQQSRISFVCPGFQISKNKPVYFKSGSYVQALQSCMKVPPLAQTESPIWAFISEAKSLVQELKSMGAQKIIYIGAIPTSGMNWGKEGESVEGRDKYFWAQVVHGLNPKWTGVDHVLQLSTESHSALDFKNARRIIEDSEQKAQEYFSKFARTYSF